MLRRYAETRYAAKSWGPTKRRVAARIEASPLGLDIRFVVTSIEHGSAEHIYDTLYCARGQAENLIKLHKTQLKSDRTSCRSANANQMRLILHTAAYLLMWKLRQTVSATAAMRNAEFATIRIHLIKIAARVIETASRIRIAFASACPDADMFRHVAPPSNPRQPERRGWAVDRSTLSRNPANLSAKRDRILATGKLAPSSSVCHPPSRITPSHPPGE